MIAILLLALWAFFWITVWTVKKDRGPCNARDAVAVAFIIIFPILCVHAARLLP